MQGGAPESFQENFSAMMTVFMLVSTFDLDVLLCMGREENNVQASREEYEPATLSLPKNSQDNDPLSLNFATTSSLSCDWKFWVGVHG